MTQKIERMNIKKVSDEGWIFEKRILWSICISLFIVLLYAAQIHADTHPYTMGSAAVADGQVMVQEGNLYADSSKNTNVWNRVSGICYNGVGEKIPNAVTRGVDISEWQGNIDWTQVKKSEVDFAFIRCGYTYENSSDKYCFGEDYMFAQNMQTAAAAGLPVGVYIYSKAKNEAQAIADAKKIVQMVQGYKVSYPIVLDMEEQWQLELGKEKITSMMKAFCDEVKKYGYYPMIYSNLNWYLNGFYPADLSEYELWIAAYYDKSISLPSYCRHSIWQCTSGETGLGLKDNTGVVKGIKTNVDMNIGYVDYTKIIEPRTVAQTAAEAPSAPVEVKTGWQTENGETYYYVNNQRVTGVQKIGDAYYYFRTQAEGSAPKGSMVHDQIIKYGNYYYYMQSNGKRKETGFVNYKGYYYYIYKGKAYTGLGTISGKTYYFNSNGIAQKKGWVTVGDKKYYLKNYVAVKGAYGKYYFHETKCYAMKNYKVVIKNKVYYYGSDYKLFKGGWKTLKINNKKYTYYFDKKTGAALQGWKNVDGRRYYFKKGKGKYAGARYESKVVKSGGKTYVFASNGTCTIK